jgi:heme/copper-type cytochrome/quinol oxidase subunit 3
VTSTRVIDVSTLPPGAFGHRSLMWWGTCGLILIEGTAFALAIGMYLYYWTHAAEWPPGHTAPPRLLWGTLNTVILLASAVPNQFARNAAERVDLRSTQRWMVVALIFGIGFNVVRAFEFGGLNVKWNQDAYGSIVWLLLGLHTTHIVTDVLDSCVLAALLFVGPVEERRFVDVSENSVYWYFVVLAWLPIYAVIYLAPRFL